MTNSRLLMSCVVCSGLALAMGKLSAQSASAAQTPGAPAIKVGDPERLVRLKASLAAKTPLVNGVNRGWEGDPNGETWVTRCDKQHEANACWLAGMEMVPGKSSNGTTKNYDYRGHLAYQLGRSYLERGCEYGSGEACADLGDLSRFSQDFSFGREAHYCWGVHQEHCYWEGVNREPLFDLKHASSLYARSCERESAYGCYVWAEFVDRGIGVAADHALAQSLFAELCSAGLPVGCLRATQAPAARYPYKLYSLRDSTCGTDQECWSQCAKGEWGACDRFSEAFYQRFVDNKADSQLPSMAEFSRVRARACSEGVDWGCRGSSSQNQSMVAGCKAGSAMACSAVCGSNNGFTDGTLKCSALYPDLYSHQFKPTDSIALHMNQCFEGVWLGCFDHMPGIPMTDTKMEMTNKESSAYGASAQIFGRMECNSGYSCVHLANYFSQYNLDPQRGWAYYVAASAGSIQGTPLEQVMGRNWAFNDGSQNAPRFLLSITPDVAEALDKGCLAGNFRACWVLADFYGKTAERSYLSKARQDLMAGILASAKGTQASAEAEDKRCGALPDAMPYMPYRRPGDLPAMSPREHCLEASRKHYDKMRQMDEKSLRAASKLATTITEYDPEKKAKAMHYWALACQYGFPDGCENYTYLNTTPNLSYH